MSAHELVGFKSSVKLRQGEVAMTDGVCRPVAHCRTQSIEGFLVSQASAAAMATAAAGGAKRRKSSAPGAGPLGGSGAPAAAAGADGEGVFGADGLFSNASLHLQAAAAEEAAAAAELATAPAAAAAGDGAQDSAEVLRLQQHEALLRPVAQPRLPAVQTQLSSVWELLAEVQDGVHGELQQLFKSHTWVGMVRLLLAVGLCKGQPGILFSFCSHHCCSPVAWPAEG